MPEPTKDELRKEIAAILKDANLEETAAKKVRLQLEDNLKCDLSQRKKEVDDLVMEYVNAQDESGEEDEQDEEAEDKSEEEEESEDEAPKKKGKRAAPAKRGAPASKKKKGSDSEEEESEEEASDDDYKPNKGAKGSAKKGAAGRKKKGGSDSDSDEDWKKSKPAKGAKKKGGAKGTGYTRAYNLSPELAAICGAEALPRHEVVKKVWAIIKERNLYDPKNKQYAICDSELQKVIGVKRFRTFGMLKYLKSHFLN
uniref:Putative rna polymerase i transcription factor uaf n=1 Tax=Culex tarsalis TaxID=7177 RepID=A0A1Q3EX02_CULTA